MKAMDPSELVKQPQDVTENPYRRPVKDKTDAQKTSFSTAEEEVQYKNTMKVATGYYRNLNWLEGSARTVIALYFKDSTSPCRPFRSRPVSSSLT